MSGSAASLCRVLLAVALTVGLGTALHHQHEVVADCPAGPCLEHGAHADPTPASSVSDADPCPFCELLSQGRTQTPPHVPATVAAPGFVTPLAKLAPAAPAAPDRGTPRARAPPASA